MTRTIIREIHHADASGRTIKKETKVQPTTYRNSGIKGRDALFACFTQACEIKQELEDEYCGLADNGFMQLLEYADALNVFIAHRELVAIWEAAGPMPTGTDNAKSIQEALDRLAALYRGGSDDG